MKRITKRLISDVSGYWSEWQEWADRTIEIIAEAIGEVPDNMLSAAFPGKDGLEVMLHSRSAKRQCTIKARFKREDGNHLVVERIDEHMKMTNHDRTLDPIDWMRDEVAWVSGGTT